MTSILKPIAAAPVTLPDGVCGNCLCFSAVPGTEGGICRRFPPTPIVIYGQDVLGKPNVRLEAHFPPVTPLASCGEHTSEDDAQEFDS